MNKAYRLVWNSAAELWQVAAEIARACRRKAGARKRMLLAAALIGLPLAAAAGELPMGGAIRAGSGAINVSGDTLTVTQDSARLAIDWQSFSIGEGNTVRFLQPGADAAALNRVLGADPSRIFGSLQANGQVFLINPNGVLFGSSARVDVGGLVASTLDLPAEDFMAGDYRFAGTSSNAVVNQGSIEAAPEGMVALVGARVENTGTLTAPGGHVLMAAGQKVRLDLGGPVKLEIEQGALDALVRQGGAVYADGGKVYLTAKAAADLPASVINHDGITQARSLEQGANGEIVLLGEGGDVTVAGALDVSSPGAHAGKAVVTGERVLVDAGARIDATGASGGGEIYVGGGWQGRDPDIENATATVVAEGATLDASATKNGDGGTLVVWSDVGNDASITRVGGALRARGGAEGGDGGRIETSGHGLEVSQAPDVGAVDGAGGEWLIDPYNITVVAGSGHTNINTGSPFLSTGNSASLGVDLIDAALGSGDVVIQTAAAGGQGGDIYWNTPYTYAAGTARSLTLNAHRDIVLNESIASSGGALSMTFNAKFNSVNFGVTIVNKNLTTNGGSIVFNGTGTSFNGGAAQQITTGGGDVTFNGEVLVANPAGVTLSSNGGAIAFNGRLDSGNSYAYDATSRTWADALNAAKSGDGDAVGDTYLATITSVIENSAALAASGGSQAWLGGSDQATEGTWRWVAGPEGLEDGGQGRIFQIGGVSAGITGYNGENGAYVNWNGGEPNNAGNEDALQQGFGTGGQWNDYPTSSNVLGSIVETNLAPSPLTINAGAGTVTFAGKVGAGKPLGDLTIDGTGTVRLQTDTVVSAGTVNIDPATQLDAGAGTTYNVRGAAISWNSDIDYDGIGAGSTLALDATTGSIGISADVDIGDSAPGGDALSIVLDAGDRVDVYGTIQAGGGNIDIDAGGLVYVENGSVATSGAGTIDIYSASSGVQLNTGTVQVENGTLSVDASGNVNPIWGGQFVATGSGDISLTSRTGGIYFGGSSTSTGHVTSAGGDIALTANTIEFRNSSQAASSGALLLQPYTTGASIGIGGAAGTLSLAASAFTNNIANGFSHITIGRADGAGAVNIGTVNFRDDVTIRAPAGSADITVTGALASGSGSNAGSISLQASRDVVLASGSSITTQGSDVTLAAGDKLAAATGSNVATNGGAFAGTFAAAGTMEFRGAVSTGAGNLSLASAAGTQLVFDGSSLNTTSGNLSVTVGSGGNTGARIDAQNGATFTTASGDIALKQIDSNGSIHLGVSGSATVQATGSGDVTLDSADTVYLSRDSAISANGGTITFLADATNLATLAGGSTVSNPTGTVVFHNAVTQAASGTLAAGNLLLLGTGNVTLDQGSVDVDTLAAGIDGSLSLADSDALAIGSVNGTDGVTASGPIAVSTGTGNLTVNQAVSTADATASALALNAGRASAAGTSTGGDIVLNAAVSVGAGGRATLYTGSLAGSSGVVAAAGGSGSGNFRYGSDKTTTNYTAALGSGTYVVYRERPTLNVTPDAANGPYGDAPDLSGATYTASGYRNGDSGGMAGTASFSANATATSNVGAYNITYTGGLTSTLGYLLADNAASVGEYTVQPRVLNLSGGRVYDGTTLLDAGIFSLGNLAHGETLVLSGTGSMADKHVGDDKAVALGSLALADGTGLASNYTLAGGMHTADITAKALAVSGITAANKVYDGNTTATVDVSNATLAGLVAGDAVTVNATGAFASKNVGNGKTVNLTSTYGGADAGNYSITDQATTTANITPKALAVSGITAANKVYDGTTAASIDVSGVTLTGLVAGDAVTVNVTGAFDSKNVGNGKTVNLASTYGGGDVGNYSITDQAATTANITPKALTVSGITAASKVYDGNTSATVDVTGATFAGLVIGDTVTVDATGNFVDKNVGNGKAVNLTSTYGGADAGNYSITDQATTTANITPKALTVTADDKTAIYDGAVYDGGFSVSYAGFVSGEDDSVLGGVAAYGGDAVTAIQPGTYTITVSGFTSANYAIDYVDGALTIRQPLGSDEAIIGAQSHTQALLSPAFLDGTGGAEGTIGSFDSLETADSGDGAPAATHDSESTEGGHGIVYLDESVSDEARQRMRARGQLPVVVVTGGVRMPFDEE